MNQKQRSHFISICVSLFLIFILSGIWAVFPFQKARAQGIPSVYQNLAAMSITVTNNADSGAGSLRQAIADVSIGGTITFSPSLAGQTIILISELYINKSMTIDGSGLNPRMAINGNHAVRIIFIDRDTLVDSNINVTINSLVLENGRTTDTSANAYGGAVHIDLKAIVSINNVTFSGNQSYMAGAILVGNETDVTIVNSDFLSNSSEMGAGAIYLRSTAVLTMEHNRFFENSSSSGGGGAIWDSGTLVFRYNTISNNIATTGGAIYINSSLTEPSILEANLFSGNSSSEVGPGGAIYISHSSLTPSLFMINNTFFGNQSGGKGGAIYSSGSMSLENNTFSNNRANYSGGNGGGSIYLTSGGETKLYNNIFANNTGGGECNFLGLPFVMGNNNLVEDGSSICLPLLTGDPQLESLADNGGTTDTMRLMDDSPAINAGDDSHCPITDQRGLSRPYGSHCDMGAFEFAQYNISGYVERAGIILNYSDGSPKAATTDNNGFYTFTVSSFWSGTVTPSMAGYIFSPISRNYANVVSNFTDQNYTPIEIFTISGNVGLDSTILNYSGGYTLSDSSGNYTISVPSGWSGTVKPVKGCYTFSPISRPYENVLTDMIDEDYIETPFPICFSNYLPLVKR